MRRVLAPVLFLVAVVVSVAETRAPGATLDPPPDEGALGGPATVWDSGLDAFTFPASVLDRLERRAFAVGNAFFKENWVTAPSSTEGRDGLGPLFVARSCSTCHLRDGRGRPPLDSDPESSGLLFRLGVAIGSEQQPHPVYGEQVQDRAVAGVEPEARVRIDTTPVEGRYADGTRYSLEQPVYAVESAGHEPVGDGVLLSPRVATQLIGLGLLGAIAEQTIQSRSDPEDRDGDGISGRPNFVVNHRSGRLELGRFGWKANQPTIEQQVANAFQQDLGITSSLFPREPLTPRAGGVAAVRLRRRTRSSTSTSCSASRSTAACSEFRRSALPPTPRSVAARASSTPSAAPAVTCPCRRPATLRSYRPTRNVRIRPYTDLLLHDLGPGLADGKPDGQAAPSEWRTPPLWGIGLFATVNGHTRYLHDGRARDLAEAILWHGGEATRARADFERLSAAERAALIAFLNSL